MAEEQLIEIEERRDRSTVAATLRSLATQLEGEGGVTLTAGAETVTVAVPSHLTFELTAERDADADEGEEVEIELELSWNTADLDEAASEVGTAAETVRTQDDDPTAPATEIQSQGQFQVYKDRADEWRWRLVHRNGNVIADSGEGYTTRQNAEKGLRSVMKNAPGAVVNRVE